MQQSITFKTELSEIITLEEIAMLFDNIAAKYSLSLVALSLYPKFIKLKQEIIETTKNRRNYELSCLLTELYNKKEEIKKEIDNHLNKLDNNKNKLKDSNINQDEVEQDIYEEEQIILAYKNIINFIDKKEKKIASGKYTRINKIATLPKNSSLKRQLEYLQKSILIISEKHNNCFDEYKEKLESLIKDSILKEKHMVSVFSDHKIKIEEPKKFTGIFENIEYINDENKTIYYEISNISKDFYLYEPNKRNFDDELIYQLLNNANYSDEDGSINAIIITNEIEDIEE